MKKLFFMKSSSPGTGEFISRVSQSPSYQKKIH